MNGALIPSAQVTDNRETGTRGCMENAAARSKAGVEELWWLRQEPVLCVPGF